MPGGPVAVTVMERLGALLADLDRCVHGRHSVDPCLACPGGTSTGNPHLPPGTVIGYGLGGESDPIVVPQPGDRNTPEAWRPRR